MKSVLIIISSFLLLITFKSKAEDENTVRDFIRQKIEQSRYLEEMYCHEEKVIAYQKLTSFYRNRLFEPAWVEVSVGDLRIQELLNSIGSSYEAGLLPADYHFKFLKKMIGEGNNPLLSWKKKEELEELAEFDLLLTDAFLMLAAHFLQGKTSPETVDAQWNALKRNSQIELDQYLEATLTSGNISESLNLLLPSQPSYKRLKTALAHYRSLQKQGDWKSLPVGVEAKIGDEIPFLEPLVEKLKLTNDLSENAKIEAYDSLLSEGVARFQKRHGIVPTGVLDARTIAELNVPISERIQAIKANMERWRWLPQEFNSRRIIANIADYQVYVVDEADTVLNMKAMVGKTYRQTPVFSSKMNYLVINPYWTVPPGILKNDVIPALKKDPGYLKKKNMKLLDPKTGEEVAASSVDWKAVSVNRFPYMVRQDPGNNNALGYIKFLFPNKYDVYMHDTPSRELFRENDRAFSSGCLRINQVAELATFLMKDQAGWDLAKIKETIKKKEQKTLYLKQPIDVHILYLTAFVTPDNQVHFRRDIYARDEKLKAELKEGAPL